MAATFTVEIGTGLSNANSYLSITDADAYHLDYSGSTAWSGAANADKEKALRLATQYIDIKYSGKWQGFKLTSTQALAWPRTSVYDVDNIYVDDDEIPQAIKDACAELALKVIEGDTLMGDLTVPGNIKSETKKLGIMEKTVEYVGGKGTAKKYNLVDGLIKPFTNNNDSLMSRG